MTTKPTLDLTAFARSPMAVPPLARDAEGRIDEAANAAIIKHIEAGGIELLLYGGNAVFYHLPLEEYEPVLSMLERLPAATSQVVPAVGPTYGLMMEHAKVLRQHSFATAMVLPHQGITTSSGVATGVRRFVEAAGMPALLYIKHEGFIEPEDAAALCRDGLISAIKYAIVRDNPAEDATLRRLVDLVDPAMVISGIGEQPAIVHMRDFGLGGFTTGCGCVAPRLSVAMRAAAASDNWDEAERIRRIFEPLEDLRNAISPICVLHEAVAAAGVAATGPLLPLLDRVPEASRSPIAAAAQALLTEDRSAFAAV